MLEVWKWGVVTVKRGGGGERSVESRLIVGGKATGTESQSAVRQVQECRPAARRPLVIQC